MAQEKRHPKLNEFIVACCASAQKAEYLLRGHPELLCARDEVGETALHYLAIENRVEAVRFLLKRGAEVDARDHSGSTPLMHAALLGLPEMVRLLIEHGANVDARDQSKDTPLHFACQAKKNGLEIVRLVLDAGADPNARNGLGDTPLEDFTSRKNEEVVRLLREAMETHEENRRRGSRKHENTKEKMDKGDREQEKKTFARRSRR